jgi:hypothetical protein
MTVRELYEFAIERGMRLDPRGSEELTRQIASVRAEYATLDEPAKRRFDVERLANPFGDTRIACGDANARVERLVCGIDIDGTEVLLADSLRQHGRPVDLVLAHHASAIGGGIGSRLETIWPQVKMLADFGVPEHKAHKLVRPSSEGDQRSHNLKVTQIAQALGLPLMTIHSPADAYLLREGTRVLREQQPRTVGDLVDICDSWPEVSRLIGHGKGTEVAVGDKRDPLGAVYQAFYGGWNPTAQAFEALCDAGCGTLWVVATSEELNRVARDRHASVVVVPHYPADNVGLNMLLDDAMDRFGDFDVVETSNFLRHDRRTGRGPR